MRERGLEPSKRALETEAGIQRVKAKAGEALVTEQVSEAVATLTPPKRGRGRPPGAKNKSKPIQSTEVVALLQTMVEKVVREQLGSAGTGPTPEPILEPKMKPASKTELTPAQTQAQAELLFEPYESALKIPNPRTDMHYVWVHTHPMVQNRYIRQGFTFVVGEAECRYLGFEPRHVLTSNGRIRIDDMELASQPRDFAEKRRAYFTMKSKTLLDETLADYRDKAGAKGGITPEVNIHKEMLRTP